MKSKRYKTEKFPTRFKKRCRVCGRARRVILFNICQIHIRELANQGFIPGVKKSLR